jgi:hypothetical protein
MEGKIWKIAAKCPAPFESPAAWNCDILFHPMRRPSRLLLLLVLLSTSVALADPPSQADLLQLWKQGDYAGVVKGTAEALQPGGVSDPSERFKVAWLGAEAQLRLRQAQPAIDAFNAAAKETDDNRQQAVAKATALLIGRSKDFIYTSQTIKPPPAPKVPLKPREAAPPDRPPATTSAASKRPAFVSPVVLPRGEFDIIEPAHRTEAMQAMWTDERIDAARTIKEKIAAKSLPAISQALDRITAAEPIAVAAGSADWPQTQRDLLVNGARVDVNTTMKDMNARLIAIIKLQVKRRARQHPIAMPQDQRDQINQMTQTLDQIHTALKALPEALHVDKDTFAPELDHASQLEDRATTVLATD